MSESRIPLVDLDLQHSGIAEDIRRGIDGVLNSKSFILGPEAERFERAYAEFIGVKHCIGVGNGTDAIELAIRGCGVGGGDEVIVPVNTFIATAEAVIRAGARPVLVDCDENYLIDAAGVAEALTGRTKCVVPVHLYGQMAPMKTLAAALPDDIAIVEDAAQAQGAMQDGHRAGSVGRAAGTSFYPGKNLGAYGDAGAVTTDDDEIADRLRALRNHGGVRKYEHLMAGVNSRLDGIQAAVLSVKLRKLDAWNAERNAAARTYDELLCAVPRVTRPEVAATNDHVWHLYVIRVPDRDRILAHLHEAGIDAGIHYPAPLHLLPAFADLGHRPGEFPIAERLASEILSLPIYPGITVEQQTRVVEELTRAIARTR